MNDLPSICCQYLLGELSGDDLVAFEDQLATSPTVQDELLRQSDLLLMIAPQDPTTTITSPPTTQQRTVPGLRPLAATALALAASLAIVVSGWLFQTNDSSEELQIAQAWASSLSSTTATTEPAFDDDLLSIETTEIPEDFASIEIDESSALIDDGDPDDQSFGWMYVAVAAADEQPDSSAAPSDRKSSDRKSSKDSRYGS
ncbi:hypothetical protein [Rubripirellula lacrimiformis]|nr:hypothetical protein [Rubripirellula lacrimiformis]